MPKVYDNQLEQEPLYERVESFHGGMDEYSRPTLIRPDQCALLKNMLMADNGTIKTRPGAADLSSTDANRPAATAANRIQGIAYFDIPGPTENVIAYVSDNTNGVPHVWGGSSWSKPSGGTINKDAIPSLVQAEDKLYVFDGSTAVKQWNGTTFTAMGTTTADPPYLASIACWHAGRMFAAKGDYLYYSDLVQAGDGAWEQNTRNLRPGRGEGENITALAGLPQFWLAVFKEQSIFLVNADPSVGSLSQAQIAFLGRGPSAVGKNAVAVAGGDAYFMARDGVRSVRRLVTAEDQFEIAAPLSQPMQPYIDRINWTYAHKICAFAYREYVGFSVPLDAATEPDYTLVFNIRLNAWCGFWTGWNPTCFAVSRFENDNHKLLFGDTLGRVNQFKDHLSEGLLSTFQDNGTDIATTLRTRSFLFGEPISSKDGWFFECRFIETTTAPTISLYLDEDFDKSWTYDLADSGATLPVSLPFVLERSGVKLCRGSLTRRGSFNECYLEITSSIGKIEVKNVTIAAWERTVENE